MIQIQSTSSQFTTSSQLYYDFIAADLTSLTQNAKSYTNPKETRYRL